MISSQYGREFVDSDYGDIKKVYSIWICTHPPKQNENTVTLYYMTQKNLEGCAQYHSDTYDLVNVIMICLGGKQDANYTGIIKLLDVLLSPQYTAEYKKKVLEEEFQIPMKEKMDEEVNKMCNLSEGIWMDAMREGRKEGEKQGRIEGMKKGRIETLVSLVRDKVLSVQDAAKRAQMSEESFLQEMQRI